MGDVVFLQGDGELNELRELAKQQSIAPALKKGVLIELADRCNVNSGACFPSAKTIAKSIGCSSRTVERHIQSLKDDGFIRWEKARATGGEYRSNRYALILNGYDSSKKKDRDQLCTNRQGVGTPSVSMSGHLPTQCRRNQSTNLNLNQSTATASPSAGEIEHLVRSAVRRSPGRNQNSGRGKRDPKVMLAKVDVFIREREALWQMTEHPLSSCINHCCNTTKPTDGQKLAIANAVAHHFNKEPANTEAKKVLLREAVNMKRNFTNQALP